MERKLKQRPTREPLKAFFERERHTSSARKLECEMTVEQAVLSGTWLAICTVRWENDSGPGQEQWARTGMDGVKAVEAVRDAALDDQRGESRRYIEKASAQLLLELTRQECSTAGGVG